MPCVGTYLGQCCGPPPVDDHLRAIARVKGYTSCRRALNQDHPGERQQLFNGYFLQLDWSFTHAGVGYSGSFSRRSERPGTDFNDPFVTTDLGVPFITPFGALFDFVYDAIDQIVATGRIRKRREDSITEWDDVGVMETTMLTGLPSAVSAALADVNSYDPATGTWGTGHALSPTIGPTTGRLYRTVERPRGAPDAGLDIGTIAPACGALPPNANGMSSSQFFAPTAMSGHTAVVNRAGYGARPGKLLRLVKNYTPECGFPGPPPLTECEAVDASSGVDLTPSEVLPGYQIVSVTVTEHPAGTNPC